MGTVSYLIAHVSVIRSLLQMPSDEMKKTIKDFLRGYRPLLAPVNGISRPVAHSKDTTARWVIRNYRQRLSKIDAIAKDCEIMDAILGECEYIEVLDAVDGNIYRITAQKFNDNKIPWFTDDGGEQYRVYREKWDKRPAIEKTDEADNKLKKVALF